jgi:hypothetical protein
MLAQIFKHYAACTDFSPLFVDNNSRFDLPFPPHSSFPHALGSSLIQGSEKEALNFKANPRIFRDFGTQILPLAAWTL